MKLQPVKNSTSIKGIGYDADAKELHVEFHSGTTYTYPGISAEQHAAFMGAESKGRHFQAHIRSPKAKQVA